jgi:hypothetical protein
MNFVRRTAVWMAGFTARHASPGSQEWAEGLAREVEVIDSDWRALAWAVGSTRVLLTWRQAPIRSLEEIPAAARRLRQASNIVGLIFWSSVIRVIIDLDSPVHFTDTMQRAGVVLAMLGYICFVAINYRLFYKQKQKVESPIGDWTLFYTGDINAWVLFYRAELESRLRQLGSPGFWLSALALLLVCTGMTLISLNKVFMTALMGSGWLGLVLLLLSARRNTRMRLQQLEILLPESEDAN